MKSLLLMVLIYLLSLSSVYADITGIWRDADYNYFSVQEKNGKILFLDLSRSLPRATSLMYMEVEQKPEYLAYFGDYHAENFSDVTNFTIPPLYSLKTYFSPAETITDLPLMFGSLNEDKLNS